MYQVAILKNETQLDHLPWIEACMKRQNLVSYDIIDLTKNDWLRFVTGKDYDIFLLRPPGRIERFKKMYDERVFILDRILGKKVYPSSAETAIYENKCLLRDWLIANDIPHPQSFVFYNETEATSFSGKITQFPIVAKTNIGASGNGVIFLNSRSELNNYIKKAFTKGIRIKGGPKIFKGSIFNKTRRIFSQRNFLKQRWDDYKTIFAEEQKGIVFLQEFIPHSFEWRCVRIGESYFAHKKIARNNKSSGTLIKEYGPVPESLLYFIKEITDKAGIQSTSIDLFETDSKYLVNEIQCFFGQSDPYQMLVDGKPGRYRFIDNRFSFEEGDFARDACYDLRLEHAITLLS